MPRSDERFARQYRCGPPPGFPLASPRPGIVHHLSGPDGRAPARSPPRGGAGPRCAARRARRCRRRQLPCASRASGPAGSRARRTPWSVFQDGPDGGPPRAGARSPASPRPPRLREGRGGASAPPGRPRPPRQPAPARAPPRSAGRRRAPSRVRAGRVAGPHPLPSRQFQALFDPLFKVLFIFPSRYLFAIGLSRVFCLGRSLPPRWGCGPGQPDSPGAARAAARPRGRRGSHPLRRPLPGDLAPARRRARPLHATRRGPPAPRGGARFPAWARPVSLAATRGILVSFSSSAY